MKCDRISGIVNQIHVLSADEIVPNLNHSGIYNTQNSQQTYALESIFKSCGARMSAISNFRPQKILNSNRKKIHGRSCMWNWRDKRRCQLNGFFGKIL